MRALLAVTARLIPVALVAAVLVALTSGASGEDPGRVVRTTLNGEDARIALPLGGAPKGLAIWFHGQGGNIDAHAQDPFLVALYRDGWAVATSTYHSASWGNPASTDDTRRLIDWAEDQAGVPATLWVAGSMGGTVSLNAMNFGVETPQCWYGVHPALSLTQMDNVPGGPRFIREAYQGDPPEARDPIRNIGRLPSDVRYRVVASREDPLVIYDENATPLIDGLESRGIEVSERIAYGDHEDPSHWSAPDLLTFADGCLPGSTGTTRASQ